MINNANFGGIHSILFFGITPFDFTYFTGKYTTSEQETPHGKTYSVEVTAEFPERAMPNQPRKIWLTILGNDNLNYQIGDTYNHLLWKTELSSGPTPESAKVWRFTAYGTFGLSPLKML